MQMSHTHMQRLFIMFLVVFPTGLCEQNQSRRSVTEHQLMHDRGRNIQSLKRLIWLSSAIEDLHTAQIRSAAFSPRKALNLALDPDLVPAATKDPQPAQVQKLLRDFLTIPHLLERES
ncbi:parathyroid hormone 4 [Dunckerocampus dactyliophorus]|uniref:parathyroid hormone 4 n=1 Tax=Dunckerocampus dactyliophorus TaxID=161453 RepID=UPI002404D007|nr:parathyroid hormone 4 [Dunckerocampus dactyliophorus]